MGGVSILVNDRRGAPGDRLGGQTVYQLHRGVILKKTIKCDKIPAIGPAQEGLAVIDDLKDFDEEIPKWDIALAALAKEEAGILGQGLLVTDFQRLAEEHAIRFDDIMVTMFELVIQGEWRYETPEGVIKLIDRDEVEKLYVGGRLVEKDVKQYEGLWSPVP